MREIEFRGKCIRTGDWIYGYCKNNPAASFALIESWVEKESFWGRYAVISESVGQYTGLKDKNGVNIFEGDILQRGNHNIGVVTYIQKYGCFDWVDSRIKDNSHLIGMVISDSRIIGNKHDNPELLEAGE